MDPIFEVSIKLEAIEVTYHHVITFLYTEITRNIFLIVNCVIANLFFSRFFSVRHGGNDKLFQI